MATTITFQSRRQDKLQDHPEALVALFNLGRSWAEHVITSDFGPFENMAAFGAVWTELLSGDCEIIELLRELNRPERDYDEALKMVVRAGYDLLPDELLTYNNR
jgi:hypothetical protein